MTFNEILVNSALLIFVVALLFKRMLWLRILTEISCIIVLIYSYGIGGDSFRFTIFWGGLIFLVNSYRLFLLLKENIIFKFSNDEKKLHKTVFPNFTDFDFKKLMKISNWQVAKYGTVIIEQDTQLDDLMLLYSGYALVEVNDEEVAAIREGSFMGELSFLSGNKTNAKVIADTQIRYITFPKKELIDLMKANLNIEAGLKSLFNTDLVNKLSTTFMDH